MGGKKATVFVSFCVRADTVFPLPVLQPTPTSKFLQGYAGAVTSAVSLAVSIHLHL